MLDDLIATEGVREIHRPGGPVGVMAIHGGLEEGTATIAEVVAAATGASLYAVVQPQTLWWHVPSINYDPALSPALRRFIDGVATTVSLHGYGEPGFEGVALLGGNNRAFAWAIHAELVARGIDAVADLDAIPARLRGIHRRNPVNLPPEAGVQVELPMELRAGPALDEVAAALGSAVTDTAANLPGAYR